VTARTHAPRRAGDAQALADRFLAWQCRIRQRSMRRDGRPSEGMRPGVASPGARPAPGEAPRITAPAIASAAITVVLVPRAAPEVAGTLRHLVLKTHDPAERYAQGLRLLAAEYYEDAGAFEPRLAALFGPRVPLADALLGTARCELDFREGGERFFLPCAVRALAESDPAFAATYWHNRLFNPAMPAGVRVLEFQPDWHAAAEVQSSGE